MVSRRWLALALLGIVGLGVMPVVDAKGFYFGGSLGRTEAKDLDLSHVADGSVLTGATEGSDNGWKAFGGFHLFRFMTTELDYRDYGQVSFSATSDGSGTVYAAGPLDGLGDLRAASAAALVVVPAGKFKFWVKGGVSRWSIETVVVDAIGSLTQVKDEGTDSLFGAGGSWDYNGPGALRVEYERIEIGGTDLDFMSAGVQIRF